ncbi:hypothetical protein OU798_15075 [Prolixibacteraceae bacterium Z1-6]|uniref:Uncharacterized protein n=1 Tax=Draconibacterium aestuarii TaxID=2998507 RepID=A0A9X3FAE0_9BACT|nr:hypothetical protein [Prolixibacteraceae bacterium Z1-6]
MTKRQEERIKDEGLVIKEKGLIIQQVTFCFNSKSPAEMVLEDGVI